MMRLYTFLLLGMMVLGFTHSAYAWEKDFAEQPIESRPKLEVRYTDGERTAFEIVAEAYHVSGDLRPPHALEDAATEEIWLGLWLTDKAGKRYAAEHTAPSSRINLYRRGPYFCEVRWLDVQLATPQGDVAPLKGDLALYCYPDKLLAAITWHALEDFEAEAFGVEGKFTGTFSPKPFTPKVRQTFAFPLFGETSPLPESALESIESVAPLRYDLRRGCYAIGSLGDGGFQGRFYHTPNGYDRVRFRVTNGDTPRTIYICHENTGGDKGSVEGGVLLDAEGHPLPITVQISKNFAGEKEEKFYNPKDTAFSETYFPLVLAPGESRELTSLHLYQNWGNHMVKQFSSLGAWMDYFHSSTGVTETTCYVPFKFGGLPGIDIADFRAMSQYAFWPGQPQHDNIAGHSFLRYHDTATWRYLVYRGTAYRSTGPNWMDIGFTYRSTDGAIEAAVDSIELPQADELRQFVSVRYEVKKPLTIEDARVHFRLLTATSRVQRLRHKHFAASGMDDVALTFDDNHYPVRGHALPWEDAFLAVYGDPGGGNAFVLRRWNADIEGASVGPAAAVFCDKRGDSDLFLTVDADTLTLKPGDAIEFDAVLMPFGATHSADAARREAIAYGVAAPRVIDVDTGVKIRDFPTTLKAEKDEAVFTLRGGRNLVPIVVTGLSGYRRPRLYRRGVRGWQAVGHARVDALDGVQTFCDGKGTFGAVFLTPSDDTPQAYRVTLDKEQSRPKPIQVSAAPAPDQQPWLHAARIQAPWMKAPIVFRYPETLYTDGQDFIDHHREDMPPRRNMSMLAADWRESEGGSIWFEWEDENQIAGGRLSPDLDSVDLEFWIENRRDAEVPLVLQFCPMLTGTCFEDRSLDRTWVLINGTWTPMAVTDRGDGDKDLCHYGVAGGPEIQVPPPWGASGDTLDTGAVAVTSPDGKYVFAVAWPDAQRILSNTKIPCVHVDPPPYPVPPEKRLHIRGKVFLIDGTLDDLKHRLNREITPLSRAGILEPGTG